MKVLEKKLWEEPKTEEDKEVILLISDDKMRNYNVGIMKATPIMDLTNAVYLFPYGVSEEKARKTFEELKEKLNMRN
jgi:hypothetical protein